MSKRNPSVLWSVEQGLNTDEKAQARSNIGVADAISGAINALDAEEVSTDGTNVQFQVTETDGKITGVSVTTDNTVNATDVSNAITTAITDLDSNATSTDGTNVQVKVTETDGKITGVNITSDNTVNATDVGTAITTALGNLDSSATSTDGTNVQVKVTETDGKITGVNITSDNTVNATDVGTAITTAITDLDYSDSAVTNQFVTSVSEADGIISVTRAQPSIGDLAASGNTNYSIGTNVSTGEIEEQNLAVSSATDGGNSDDLTFVSSVTQASNGKIAVTTKKVPYSIQFIDTSSTYEAVLALITDGKYPVVRYQNGYDTLYLPMFTAPNNSGTDIEFRGFAKSTANTIYKIVCEYETGFGELTSTAFANADWNATSGPAQILNKPTIPSVQYKYYGGAATNASTLLIDSDDPDGYADVIVDSTSQGMLVAGPYKTLLDSGINNGSGVGDANTPVYITSEGTFAECSISDAKFIQFDLNNTTTAQDAVYAAIDAAYAARKFPVLYSVSPGGKLYWFPNARTASRYSFAYHTSSKIETATFMSASHILSLEQKSIIDYTAGTGIAINGSTISCTVSSPIYTQNNGQGGIVEHQVSKLSLDTDCQQILADGNDIGVYAPTPAIAATDKVLMVAAGSDAPVWMDKLQIVTRSAPYSTDVDITKLAIYDPGQSYGSVVQDQGGTAIGYFVPKYSAPADVGKVLTVVDDSGYKCKWVTPTYGYPQIDYMTHSPYTVKLSAANYLYMEDGVVYDIKSDAGGSYTLHLMTNSTTTIHSKIYLWSEQANCMSATIVYEDEAGEVAQLQFTYGNSSQTTMYALDVYARQVHVSDGFAYDQTLCRVYDYPCANRDEYSYNEDIGRVVEYMEPL